MHACAYNRNPCCGSRTRPPSAARRREPIRDVRKRRRRAEPCAPSWNRGERTPKGDSSPTIFLSIKFQMIVASKAMGVKYEDLLDLSASDCKRLSRRPCFSSSAKHKKQQAHKRACRQIVDEYVYFNVVLFGADTRRADG